MKGLSRKFTERPNPDTPRFRLFRNDGPNPDIAAFSPVP